MTFQQFIRASFQEQTQFLKATLRRWPLKDRTYYSIRRELRLRRQMEKKNS